MYSFIHTADIHFGKSKNIPDYIKRQKDAFIWIYECAVKYNIPTVVIAGDIYDKILIRDIEREACTNTILHYDKLGITTIIINGNHDWMTESRLSIWDLLMLQEKGKFRNTFIMTGNPSTLIINDISYLCIPNRGIHNGYSTKELSTIIKDMSSDKTVVVAHELIQNAITDTGHKFDKGTEINDSLYRYIALGDVHKKQRLGFAQYYSGSPIQHDFGDKLPKGILLVNLDDPDNPTLEASNHIKPFIETNHVDDLKKDAFISFSGLRKELPIQIPDNLIKIKEVTNELPTGDKSINAKVTSDLIDGLPEYLEASVLTPDEQKTGLDIIENIIHKL